MTKQKKIGIIIGGVLALSICALPVLAAEIKIEKEGKNVTLAEEDSAKNLYVAGNIISINGNVEKDLIGAGNIVSVNGDVEDDIIVAGNTVVVRGAVGGTARIAGGSMVIDGEIKEDLILIGGNITITQSSSIEGDLLVAGGSVDIQAPVNGFVRVAGGIVTVSSKIGGKLEADVGELHIESGTEIGGDLIYRASEEAVIAEDAIIGGEIDFEKVEKGMPGIQKPTAGKAYGILTTAFLIKILIGIVVGLVLVYLLRRLTEPVVKNSLSRFWVSISYGFSALILTPIAAIIFLITVIGVALSGLLAISYALFMFLAVTLAPVVFGAWIIKMFRRDDEEYTIRWTTVVIGVIAMQIAALIPYIGWLICLIFVLIALGALYQLAYTSLLKRRN